MGEKKGILVLDDEPDFAGIVQVNLETEADDYLAKPAPAEQITESIKGFLDL